MHGQYSSLTYQELNLARHKHRSYTSPSPQTPLVVETYRVISSGARRTCRTKPLISLLLIVWSLAVQAFRSFAPLLSPDFSFLHPALSLSPSCAKHRVRGICYRAFVKVILTDDVTGTGYRGEQVEIKGGYMRNFLFPGKRAIYATRENVSLYESEDRVSRHSVLHL